MPYERRMTHDRMALLFAGDRVSIADAHDMLIDHDYLSNENTRLVNRLVSFDECNARWEAAVELVRSIQRMLGLDDTGSIDSIEIRGALNALMQRKD